MHPAFDLVAVEEGVAEHEHADLQAAALWSRLNDPPPLTVS